LIIYKISRAGGPVKLSRGHFAQHLKHGRTWRSQVAERLAGKAAQNTPLETAAASEISASAEHRSEP